MHTAPISYTHGDTLSETEIEALKAFRLMRAIATDPNWGHLPDTPDDIGAAAMLHLVGLASDGMDVERIQFILSECSRVMAGTVQFSKDSVVFSREVKALHAFLRLGND